MPKISKKKMAKKAASNGKAPAVEVHGRNKCAVKKKKDTPSTNRKSQEGDIWTQLQAVKEKFNANFYFSDDVVIDLVLGILAGNHFDSDPCWIHLISPPSGGKTEMLQSIFTCDETYFLSDFTPSALISGYKDDSKKKKKGEKQEEYSLLPQLNGKLVVTKDFSLIHDKPSETRSQILSILRDVYDGYASRALGNQKPKGFHSKFNYITGMTPDIEKSWSLNTLGERFLMFRIQIENRREHARQSLKNANKTTGIRSVLQADVKAFINSIPKDSIPQIEEAMEEKILDLSDLLSTCRTYVYRERNDEMMFLPLPELASRVAKQLLRVGQSVALVRGKQEVTDDEFQIMKRIALDSLPSNRRRLLKALWDLRAKDRTLDVIEKKTGLAKTTTKRVLDDFRVLKVVKRKKKKVTVKIADKTTKTTRDYFQLTETFMNYCKNIGGIPPT